MDESDEVKRHREDNMHGEVDDQLVSAGWSITVGELRRAIANVPDDYEVMLENADVDDCDISNININRLFPPALGSPGLLVMGGGQILNSEYAYHERFDTHMEIGGDKTWGRGFGEAWEEGWFDDA